MIPNSDPPTLPDPSKWSADFNDFLKVCLVKNPEKRPTATQLLKSHPFILKAKSKAIIAQLVDSCMQEIDDYRAQEAAEAAAGGGAAAEGNSGTMQAAASPSTGTMQSSVSASFNSGTMVQNDVASATSGAGRGPAYDQGTMVFNSGTMQQNDFDDAAGAGDYGTMVLHKATLAKPPAPGALKAGDKEGADGSKPSGTTIRGKYEEPSYMRHIREASNKFKNTQPGPSSGTMLVSGASSVSPADFRDLYRTAKKFEASQVDSLTKEEIKATLAAIDKAHQAEKAQMEQTYDETKKLLKASLDRKK
jgi:hypothetical protein